MPSIDCLRQMIAIGDATYPVYIGFLPAHEILEVADAPSFTPETPQSQIASNILVQPTKDWQRPLDEERVRAIASVYNDTGELMPNPVLLSQNVFVNPSPITFNQQFATGGIPTSIWEVSVPLPSPGERKPLWILDGQHRINGLAESAQRNNPVPLVLLLNHGSNAYSAPHLAKLFAQVTTGAQKLDDLHNEWLTFAFHLDKYADGSNQADAQRRSMIAVAELCSKSQLAYHDTQISNPFFDRIRFKNPAVSSAIGAASGGFTYTCVDMKELFFRHYYSCAPRVPHLQPPQLAEQIGLAYDGLTRTVRSPHENTVFLGDAEHGQKIIQDAFLAGVMAYLLEHGLPSTTWVDLFNTLQFNNTNWNFRSWTGSLGGRANSVSKKLAVDVFTKVFHDCELPEGAGNLADFLQGNNAQIELQFSQLTPNGRPAARERDYLVVMAGNRVSPSITPRKHVKIKDHTANIGRIKIIDLDSPPGRPTHYPEINGSGLVLDPSKHANPLALMIEMEHYAETTSSAVVRIDW